MKRIALLLAGACALAGCDPTTLTRSSGVDSPEISCLTRPGGGCSFDQSPLRVLPEPVTLPKRAYLFYPTAAPLNFVDSRGRGWVAPARTLTDGASIPPIFVSVVGDPTSPEFINAAAVHDAYCGVGNETGPRFQRARWEDVHLMFYDGLITGGAQPIVAKVMFAAVWMGGPRWPAPRDLISTQGPAATIGQTGYRSLDHVPTAERQARMRSAKRYIERENPPLPQLIAYLEMQERAMLRAYPRSPQSPASEYEEETPVTEPYGLLYPEASGETAEPAIDPATGEPI